MDPALRTEAIAFSRYLVGEDPPDELVERYCQANTERLREPVSARDRAVLDFVHRHPWAIPMLDARFALGGSSLLRKKLLVMMAILETSPAFVERTEQQSLGLPRLASRLAVAGARTAVSVVAGFALSGLIARRRGR